MKITPRQYAAGLLAATSNQEQADLKVLISRFVNILVANRDVAKLDQILVEFSDLYDREQGEVRAKLTTARSLSSEIKKLVEQYIVKQTDASQVNWEVEEDKDILGGFILRYEGKVLNASLKQTLAQLKEQISQ